MGGELQIIFAADSGGAPAVLGIHPNSMLRLISQRSLPLELSRWNSPSTAPVMSLEGRIRSIRTIWASS